LFNQNHVTNKFSTLDALGKLVTLAISHLNDFEFDIHFNIVDRVSVGHLCDCSNDLPMSHPGEGGRTRGSLPGE